MKTKDPEDFLKVIALKKEFDVTVQNLFQDFNRSVSENEEVGSMAVLFSPDHKVQLSSTRRLSYKDKQILEDWASCRNCSKITNNIFKLILSNHIFLFKEYRSKSGQLVIVGKLLKKEDDIRAMAMILQTRYQHNELMSAAQ